MKVVYVSAAVILALSLSAGLASAADDQHQADTSSGPADVREACAGLPSFSDLRQALLMGNTEPGGLRLAGGANNNMWATVVNRDGIVCAVAFSGAVRSDQWPGSRVISAQKANTANAFSLPQFALSSANLYGAVQPGGSLFGLQESNPVSTQTAYRGDPARYGTADDPMTGRRIGGVNVFGGGLALYKANGELIGGIGVSGDTSCRDHRVAWTARSTLKLDTVPGGVSGDAKRPDNIVYDIPQGNASTTTPTEGGRFLSQGGFGHPACSSDEPGLAGSLAPVSSKATVTAAAAPAR